MKYEEIVKENKLRQPEKCNGCRYEETNGCRPGMPRNRVCGDVDGECIFGE